MAAMRSGRELAGVLLFDLREPGGALGGLAVVHLDAADLQRTVDLGEQLVHQVVLWNLPQRLAVGEDQALVLGARDAEVGVRRLADAVYRAAQHGHLDRLLVGLEALLDLGHHRVHVELQPAAGGAGDEHRAALAQLERLEDLPGHLDLLLRVEGGERDSDGVPHAVGQQRAEPDGRLERARPLRARLGDAEVQRVVDALGEQAVRGDRVGHVGGLDRDLEVVEVEALHELHVLHGGGGRGPPRGSRARARAGASAASRSSRPRAWARRPRAPGPPPLPSSRSRRCCRG